MSKIKKFEEFEPNNENIFIPEVEGLPQLKGTSFNIKYPHDEYKIGETVEVSIYADKHAGKKGIIGPPAKMKKDTSVVLIDFEDGTSDYVSITNINRI